MDFKAATDRVGGCITHAEIAEAAGVSIQTIRQARMDPSSSSYRNPPAGWQAVLARLARERSRELADFAFEVSRA
ncbi:MAG TPA: hypothetical protein VGB24_08630 [Longimicrobium sp.]|jgi:hypothetical protein|uniref:hypothetical protein n=1 Tax=Longimicrobium sp. TaxID=2029185 RepID=UPI002ED77F68